MSYLDEQTGAYKVAILVPDGFAKAASNGVERAIVNNTAVFDAKEISSTISLSGPRGVEALDVAALVNAPTE